MNIPENLFYTKDHEWAEFKNEEVIIGITDYAQNQLGDVIFVEIGDIGSNFKVGDIFGEIEAVKTVSELYAPISGKIIDINKSIELNPELVNNDPYGSGWLIKIEPNNLIEKEKLLDFKSYHNLIN